MCASVLAYGNPKAGTNKVHGEAMGEDAVKAYQARPGLAGGQALLCAGGGAQELGRRKATRGKEAHAEWNAHFEEYKRAYPAPSAEFERVMAQKLAAGWETKIPTFGTDKPVATRNAGQQVMTPRWKT